MGQQTGYCLGPGPIGTTQPYCTGTHPYRAECAYQGQSPDSAQQIVCCSGLPESTILGCTCPTGTIATTQGGTCIKTPNIQICGTLGIQTPKTCNVINLPTPTTNGPTPTSAATPTPLPNTTDTNGTTCSSSGIKSIKYDKTGCVPSYDAKAATVTCNDGFVVTKTASFRCESERTWQFNLQNVCSSHKICPLPTPSSTPTATPQNTPTPILATATPTPAVCDPNLDGITGDLLDYGIWVGEMLGSGGLKSDCYHPDSLIDLRDFQGWKDMFLAKLR